MENEMTNHTQAELDFESIQADIAKKRTKLKKMEQIDKEIKELRTLEAKVASIKIKIKKLNDEINA
ncbi:hypothetical protein LS71_008380 [Helicobacter jaachi]|uniref:Uncharacterized protein n=1 Tax=Helicobacter jaachi TaxID=1677920 RepID=A0A4U8T773_9HELI|nr:hypothetical protein [Helicobacter jaachi]TLD95413.1 hypothetical protein LS71_008380 [Helicobacter jaachi]